MRKLGTILALALLFVALSGEEGPARGGQTTLLGRPCVAFASDGRSAEGTFGGSATLGLRVVEPSGGSQSFDVPTGPAPREPFYSPTCGLFFSSGGRYLAASAVPGNAQKVPLQVSVLDTVARKWISSFEVGRLGNLQSGLRLWGFLGATEKLVITGWSGVGSRAHGQSLSAVSFGLDGAEVRPEGPPRLHWGWTDPAHNRVWYVDAAKGCALRATTLVGAEAKGPDLADPPMGGETCTGMVGLYLGFPDANTLLGAGTISGDRGDWVWKADLQAHSGEKLALPRKRGGPLTRSLDYIVAGGSLSPDGQVYAVSREVNGVTALDEGFYKRGEIDVVQVRPLRLIGVVRPKEQCASADAFAVYHRDDRVTVLANWCGRWQRNELPVSPRHPRE